jgi:hypothetical protein
MDDWNYSTEEEDGDWLEAVGWILLILVVIGIFIGSAWLFGDVLGITGQDVGDCYGTYCQ